LEFLSSLIGHVFKENLMDKNTELLIAKAPEAARWEDEEKASYDLESLRKGFNRHLYGSDQAPPAEAPRNAGAAAKR
jgi:hypothetical protein